MHSMLRFECDYGEGAAQPVLDLLAKTNLEQTPAMARTTTAPLRRTRSVPCVTPPMPPYILW